MSHRYARTIGCCALAILVTASLKRGLGSSGAGISTADSVLGGTRQVLAPTSSSPTSQYLFASVRHARVVSGATGDDEPELADIGLPPAAYLPFVVKPPSESLRLQEATYWAYQIQGISEVGAVDALVASHYDMLVVEPTRTDWSSDDKHFDSAGMVARLKDSKASDGMHSKLVIAYLDIGEAEDWRWYWNWSTEWDCAPPLPNDWPEYIIACDPDGWTGNYPVAYWDDEWKDVIIYGSTGVHPDRDYASAIDEAVRGGFDGIYLDWVEAFEDERVVAAAQVEGLDAAAEMITLIQEMRSYAVARNPNFVVIQQNAASLIDGHPELIDVIDAISQEAIWYDGDATDDWADPDGYDWRNDSDLVSYYIGYLEQYGDAGLPVFDCEYALDNANQAYDKAANRGYVPYVTRRSLARLTTTPPPGY